MILITGAGSFIGKAITALAVSSNCRAEPHQNAGNADIYDGIDCVIHAGRNPNLGTNSFDLNEDVELTVAKMCGERRIHLVSLGTRAVYAPSTIAVAEDDPLDPVNLYAKRKLMIERALVDILGEDLTRLRLANIFGFELDRHTFFGIMLSTLRDNGKVVFDMHPSVKRDFLPVDVAAKAIWQLASKPPGGIVNIGSGVKISTGEIVETVIDSFGSGELVVRDPCQQDSFLLNVEKMQQLTGIRTTKSQILEAARETGAQLRQHQAS